MIDHGVSIDGKWEAPKLVAESVKRLDLSVVEDGGSDNRLKSGADSLVRGLNSVVQGIVEIRNAHGAAAHGADAYAPLLDARYAEILVRATDAIVGLLFRTHRQAAQLEPLKRFQYRDHVEFDDFIDNDYGPFYVQDVPLIASEALYYTDFEAYRSQLVQFKQDRAAESETSAEGGTDD